MNLSLNFWVSLFIARFTQSYLDQALGDMPPNETLRILNLIVDVRNLLTMNQLSPGMVIMIDKNLVNIMKDLDDILKAICPLTAEWALHYSVARQLIAGGHYSCDHPGGHQIPIVVP